MKKIVVGRHVNGITINPLEYLLDDEGDLMTFESEEKAKEFLAEKGFSEEDMYWMVFDEVDNAKQTDEYEVIGECEVDENGEIVKLEREYFRQGYIYKNPNAYHNDKSAVCYVPELSDSAYTGRISWICATASRKLQTMFLMLLTGSTRKVTWMNRVTMNCGSANAASGTGAMELISVRIAEQKRRRRIMLADLLKALAEAGNKKEKEKVYRNLERVGMDRMTANVLVAEMRKEATANGK